MTDDFYVYDSNESDTTYESSDDSKLTHHPDVITASYIGVLVLLGLMTNGVVCYVYLRLMTGSVITRPFQVGSVSVYVYTLILHSMCVCTSIHSDKKGLWRIDAEKNFKPDRSKSGFIHFFTGTSSRAVILVWQFWSLGGTAGSVLRPVLSEGDQALPETLDYSLVNVTDTRLHVTFARSFLLKTTLPLLTIILNKFN